MKALLRIARNAQNLDYHKIAQKALAPTLLQDDILNLNRYDQLYDKGIDANGDSIGRYAPYTLNYKLNIAPKIGNDSRVDNITLRDTGAFYDSFRFKNEPEQVVITANVEKPDKNLEDEFGEIIGLTDENKAKVAQWVKPDFIRLTKQAILK